MKIFTSVLSGLLLTGLNLRAAVVDTVDNASTPGDGKTSLLEALTNLNDGETISFNIPGAGPHYIITPEAGYPVVSKNGIVIDGYSQPGASANTAGLREPNNAKIRIVLDSRTETPGARRTGIDYPGFGTSESCVLGLLDAHAARIQGLAFIGVRGDGSDSDPDVYNIALIKECSGSKIQGCWFGLDPAVTDWTPGPDGVVAGVYGARSAVASFEWDNFNSIGLTFGNDSNGTGDRGEFNLCMAQGLAVNLETPAVRIAGNWINVFPDGSLLNPEKQGLLAGGSQLEAMENGNPLGMLIGTDGNGSGDADEGNIIGPVVYDVVVECWGSGPGIVFAGNSVGVGLDGYPAFSLPGMGLFAIRKNSDLRVGSDMNGTGDAAEANHIHGLGAPFISWHRSNKDVGATVATVNVRRNELINNYGGPSLDGGDSVPSDLAYAEAMLTPLNAVVTLSASSTKTLLQGSVPEPKAGVPSAVIDVYLADALGLNRSPSAPQGRFWLASYTDNGAGDINPLPGQFSLDVQSLNLTDAELDRVTITANYILGAGRAVTTPFSSILGTVTVPDALSGFDILPNGAGVKLQWNGGTAPFRLFTATDPAGPWTVLTTTGAQEFVTPREGARRFYRLREGASPR